MEVFDCKMLFLKYLIVEIEGGDNKVMVITL